MDKLCKHCGKTFPDLSGRGIFCQAHRTKEKRGGRIYARSTFHVSYPEKPCFICGQIFKPKTHKSTYCASCRTKAMAINQKKYRDKLSSFGMLSAYRKKYNDQTKAERIRQSKDERYIKKQGKGSLWVPRVTESHLQHAMDRKFTTLVNEILAGQKALAKT